MNEFDICAPSAPLLKLYPPLSPPNGQPKVDLGGAMLRKAKQLALFENLNDDMFVYKSPTTKMRFIDTLRYHKPTETERLLYNLPSSMERLFLHLLNDVLAICGARKGVRFNGQQIRQVRSITTELIAIYDALNTMFQALTPAINRYKINDQNVPKNGSENAIKDEAMAFHTKANEYISTFVRLRKVVESMPRQALDSPSLSLQNDECDSEFESKVKAPFPNFLFVLIQKYRRERCDLPSSFLDTKSTLPSHPWWPTDSHPPLDSLARFSIFLASCLVYKLPIFKEELESFAILLQILKCQHEADANTLEIILQVPERSLRSLIYEFLCTVRELHAIPKHAELFVKKQKRQ
ncbi:hypothetical protein THRCLA_03550 [Thraustotheca clavata]|uniref:Uncharacterized protein n=1 Tax=Thraustotheca clavata TaxID=74557 RepID=A0A1W0A1P9_9STRA|nr:hypothetical protein THRCLA_03550 [Thraustotheca clavata]